jgi:hypothetical protein
MHVARYVRRTGRAIAIAGCVALASFAAPAAFAQDPPGNNGTVKVDGEAFDTTPGNEPHVDCIFQIDFYGFDAGGLTATVNFTGQAPTGKDIPVLTDNVTLQDDPAGGGTDLDAEKTYDLSSVIGQLGDPQPEQQGYHIKLQVDVPEGTHSTAYSKYKVFWVEDCRPTQSPTPETPKPSPSVETPKPSPSVETPAPVPTAVPAGTDAAGGGSGAGLLGLAVIASGAVAGTAVIARRRFLHDS